MILVNQFGLFSCVNLTLVEYLFCAMDQTRLMVAWRRACRPICLPHIDMFQLGGVRLRV